jgi:hypothetical protein
VLPTLSNIFLPTVNKSSAAGGNILPQAVSLKMHGKKSILYSYQILHIFKGFVRKTQYILTICVGKFGLFSAAFYIQISAQCRQHISLVTHFLNGPFVLCSRTIGQLVGTVTPRSTCRKGRKFDLFLEKRNINLSASGRSDEERFSFL